jgi:NAD(P)H dehydrogenase (quinone)
VPLRLVVRDAGGAAEVPGAEVVANPGGFDDPAGLEAALRGADTVYLVSAAEHENRLRQYVAAVDAAAAAGVQRIVSRRTTLPPTPRTLGAGP